MKIILSNHVQTLGKQFSDYARRVLYEFVLDETKTLLRHLKIRLKN